MEGTSEAYIVGMASGLAKRENCLCKHNCKFFIDALSSRFALTCVAQFPVHFIANGGGLVYAPLGPTHTATDDLALMRVIPNMTVVAPCFSRNGKDHG